MQKNQYSRGVWAASLFILFAVIYGISRNHNYYYDGLLFAGMTESDPAREQLHAFFEWNHFLWFPTTRIFYLVLHALRMPLRGYETLQLFNALIGAAGVALTFLILSGLVKRSWAVAWSLVSGFSAVYWIRSAGAENYLLGTFWVICLAGCMVAYWREPSYRHMAFMMVCAVLSAYYHLGNAAVLGAAFMAILLRRPPKGVLRQGSAAALLFGLLWLPYAIIHGWFQPGGFSKWWVWSKGLAEGYSPLVQPAGAFHWNILKNLALTGQTSVKSVLWFDSWNGSIILQFAALVLFGAVAICYSGWKRGWKLESGLGFVFLIPLLSVAALYAVWLPGMPNYWCVHTALFCLFAGALSGHLSPGRIFPVQTICLVAVVGLLAAHNLSAAVLPDKVNPRQFIVDAAVKIGEITPAGSKVIISGRGGEWNYLKMYIPYFAHRNRLAMDLYAANAIILNTDPIGWLQRDISEDLDNGIPVYITEDALLEKGTFSDFKLSSERVESLWKPFHLLPVQDFRGDPPNRLYLMWYDHFSKDVEAHIRVTLAAYGLIEQVLMVDREIARTDHSEKLAREITFLEAALAKRNAQTSARIQ
jgi:hypothetical protein